MKYAMISCERIVVNHARTVVNNRLKFVAAGDLLPDNIQAQIQPCSWFGC